MHVRLCMLGGCQGCRCMYPAAMRVHACVACMHACVRMRADKTLDRDFFMSSEEAQAFGLLDHIVTQRAEAELA